MPFTAKPYPESAAVRVELFGSTRQWFWGIILLTGLTMGGLLADLFLRSGYQDQAAARKIAELGLSWTAMAPAGVAFLRPELSHKGVDLRFIPQLDGATQSTGWFEFNPAPLIDTLP